MGRGRDVRKRRGSAQQGGLYAGNGPGEAVAVLGAATGQLPVGGTRRRVRE